MSDLSGEWRFDLTFLRGSAQHSARLQQEGDQLRGTYRSQFGEQEITGQVDGSTVRLHTGVRHQASLANTSSSA